MQRDLVAWSEAVVVRAYCGASLSRATDRKKFRCSILNATCLTSGATRFRTFSVQSAKWSDSEHEAAGLIEGVHDEDRYCNSANAFDDARCNRSCRWTRPAP